MPDDLPVLVFVRKTVGWMPYCIKYNGKEFFLIKKHKKTGPERGNDMISLSGPVFLWDFAFIFLCRSCQDSALTALAMASI